MEGFDYKPKCKHGHIYESCGDCEHEEVAKLRIDLDLANDTIANRDRQLEIERAEVEASKKLLHIAKCCHESAEADCDKERKRAEVAELQIQSLRKAVEWFSGFLPKGFGECFIERRDGKKFCLTHYDPEVELVFKALKEVPNKKESVREMAERLGMRVDPNTKAGQDAVDGLTGKRIGPEE